MNNKHLIGNALLWAAAILASALVHSPPVLPTVILPALAVGSLIVMRPKSTAQDCKN